MENQAENLTHQMTVSLRELVSGITRVESIQRRVLCSYCPGRTCRNCGGKATIFETYNVNVIIPMGTRSLDLMKIVGEGHQAPNRQQGDILIAIIMEENEFYDVEGNDIILKRSHGISFLDANTREFTIDLPGDIWNKPIQITCARTHFDYKYEMKVLGMGMPPGNLRERGDLFFQITIELVNWGSLWGLARNVKSSLEICEQPVPYDAIDGHLVTSTDLDEF